MVASGAALPLGPSECVAATCNTKQDGGLFFLRPHVSAMENLLLCGSADNDASFNKSFWMRTFLDEKRGGGVAAKQSRGVILQSHETINTV